MQRTITNFAQSRDLQRRLHELVPAGSHTYSKGEDQFPELSPQILVRADGAYTWDADGNRFIDWAMGNRITVLGHNHPAVTRAVIDAIETGVHLSRPSILELELAEYLVDLFPCAEMVKFGKNGSDVTSAATRLARAYTGRKYIARCAQHPFFSVDDWFIGTTVVNSGVPEEISNLTLQFPYNDIEALERLVAGHPGEIAAVILEPVKNDEPIDGFLEKLRRLADREGIVLVFDEMISGLRFDLRGAHHRYGVYPDLATFGKAIGSGYSFSVLAGRREIMELGGLRHDRQRVFLLSQTHGAEATGLAACRATLDECQRLDVVNHIWELGGELVKRFREVAEAHAVEDHVRIIGFDCNPQIVCTRSDGSYWPELNTSFHESLISNGVLIPWITITHAHGAEELEATLDAAAAACEKVGHAIQSDSVDSSFEGEPVKPVFRTFNRCMQPVCGRLDPAAGRSSCCSEEALDGYRGSE